MADLIVVTDLASVWWLTQCGYPATVSLMGPSCSDEQARIVCGSVAEEGCVWVLAEAAERGVPRILTQFSPHRCVRWARIPEGPPTACTPGDMVKLLWAK